MADLSTFLSLLVAEKSFVNLFPKAINYQVLCPEYFYNPDEKGMVKALRTMITISKPHQISYILPLISWDDIHFLPLVNTMLLRESIPSSSHSRMMPFAQEMTGSCA